MRIVRQTGNNCLLATCAMILGCDLKTASILAGDEHLDQGMNFQQAVNFLWCDAGVMPGLSVNLLTPHFEEADKPRYTKTLVMGEGLRETLNDAAEKDGVSPEFYAMKVLKEHFGVTEENPSKPEPKGIRGQPGAVIKKQVTEFLVPIRTDRPALLGIRYEDKPDRGFHAVLWTGQEVLDPNFDEPRKLEDYDEILEWWPLLKVRGIGADYMDAFPK